MSVPTTNEPLAPLPPVSATLVSARPGERVTWMISCTAEHRRQARRIGRVADRALRVVGLDRVALAEAGPRRHVAGGEVAEDAAGCVVRARARRRLAERARRRLSVPVSKKTLSWQVPQARRAAFFQRASAWHLAQSLLAVGHRGELDVGELGERGVGVGQAVLGVRDAGRHLVVAAVRAVDLAHDRIEAVAVEVVAELAGRDGRRVERVVSLGREAGDDVRLVRLARLRALVAGEAGRLARSARWRRPRRWRCRSAGRASGTTWSLSSTLLA